MLVIQTKLGNHQNDSMLVKTVDLKAINMSCQIIVQLLFNAKKTKPCCDALLQDQMFFLWSCTSCQCHVHSFFHYELWLIQHVHKGLWWSLWSDKVDQMLRWRFLCVCNVLGVCTCSMIAKQHHGCLTWSLQIMWFCFLLYPVSNLLLCVMDLKGNKWKHGKCIWNGA